MPLWIREPEPSMFVGAGWAPDSSTVLTMAAGPKHLMPAAGMINPILQMSKLGLLWWLR